MAQPEEVQAQLDHVKSLIDLAHERFDEGPREWLLDFNLPDLHTAIHGLYEVLGETRRLEHVAEAQQ